MATDLLVKVATELQYDVSFFLCIAEDLYSDTKLAV